MARQKDFLKLAIAAGIVGIAIGGVSIYLSLAGILKP